jgi:DNA-binding NtrC family response regulator
LESIVSSENKKARRNLVLIIDDDKLFCDSVQEHLDGDSVAVQTAYTGEDGLKACARKRVDVVLLDQMLPDAEGHTLCPDILKHNEQTKIIFITAHPSFEGAVKAIRAGAHDYLSKPFEMGELTLAMERALKMIALEKVASLEGYRRGKETQKAVLVHAGGLDDVQKLVDVAASNDSHVLITGETGTGKNVVARAIHYRSQVSEKPFVSINCAALPENLIEAELFGHEKGAFTGATATKKGIFEMAEEGTLLLDEIGEMPLNLQTKLLGVLEDRQIRRVGGQSFLPVDVRLMAATSSNLESTLGKTFRDDLFYRLSVIRIHIPPIRERPQDIPELCRYFLGGASSSRQHLELSEEEMERLKEYDWPGNVRELKNVLERAAILQRGDDLRPSELLGKGAAPAMAAGSAAGNPGKIPTLAEMEKKHIQHALGRLEGNYTHTAKALGIALTTLKRKMRKFGLL